MRELIFRGKRLDDGSWAYGSYVYQCETGRIYPENTEEADYDYVYPNTIGQYAGLSDKNGKQIFEGDILNITDAYGNSCIWSVDYKGSAFCVNQKGVNFSTYLGDFNNGRYDIEVIGNIHDPSFWSV